GCPISSRLALLIRNIYVKSPPLVPIWCNVKSLKQGSNELDSSSLPERSSPVMLSVAKHLAADRDRPFAALRVTWGDGSHCHLRFVQIEPCLKKKVLGLTNRNVLVSFRRVTFIKRVGRLSYIYL